MQSKLALEGIKVIDLTKAHASPTAAGLLAQWGAEVIHVEHPVRGDETRFIRYSGDYNYMFEQANMNKKGLTADLAQKEGREIIYKLVEKSDVFLANLRPYEIEKFDLHYETLKKINPRIIYAIFTGYGTKGPDKDKPSHDRHAYFARSGIVHMLTEPGAPPVRTRPSFGDMPSAMTLACGIMVALVARERLGIGQAVDVSLFNCGVWALSVDILECLSTKQDIDPGKESAFFNPLYNFYKTKDGRWILLTRTVRPPTDPDPYWQSVCQALEREDLDSDPRFNSSQKRSENALALIDVFNEAFAQKTLEEWEARLDEFGLFFAPIHKPIEVVKDPQARANNFFETFNHPVYGPIEVPGAPIKLSETPGSFRTPSPSLGQHSDEILLGLGYSRDEISSLRDKKVI